MRLMWSQLAEPCLPHTTTALSPAANGPMYTERPPCPLVGSSCDSGELLHPPRACGGPDGLGGEKTGGHSRHPVSGCVGASWEGLLSLRVGVGLGHRPKGQAQVEMGEPSHLEEAGEDSGHRSEEGLGAEGRGRGDKPGPHCGVICVVQKVGARGPRWVRRRGATLHLDPCSF